MQNRLSSVYWFESWHSNSAVAYVYAQEIHARLAVLTNLLLAFVVYFQKANRGKLIQDTPVPRECEILSSEKITITNFITLNATITHPRETSARKNSREEKCGETSKEGEIIPTTGAEKCLNISQKSTTKDETSWKMTLEVNATIESPLATLA